MTPRVGLDYLPATTHAPGVGRYVRELVRALVRLPDAPELSLFEVGGAPRGVPEEALGLDDLPRPPRRLRARLPRRLLGALRALGGPGADGLLGGVDLFQRAFSDRPPVGRAKQILPLAEIPAPGSAREARLRGALEQIGDVLVFSSAARQRAIERLDRTPETVHQVPVGCDHWLRDLGRTPPRADPPTLVALARVDRARAPVTVLEAVEALRAGGLEARLVWIGRRGDAADELRRELSSGRRSAFATWIESPDERALPGLVARASALVHLGPDDLTPVTPLEALALGTPVVVPRTPVLAEALGTEAQWVEPDRPGPGDLEAALAAACESARDPAAEARRRAIAAPFTWECNAVLTLRAWERILARR